MWCPLFSCSHLDIWMTWNRSHFPLILKYLCYSVKLHSVSSISRPFLVWSWARNKMHLLYCVHTILEKLQLSLWPCASPASPSDTSGSLNQNFSVAFSIIGMFSSHAVSNLSIFFCAEITPTVIRWAPARPPARCAVGVGIKKQWTAKQPRWCFSHASLSDGRSVSVDNVEKIKTQMQFMCEWRENQRAVIQVVKQDAPAWLSKLAYYSQFCCISWPIRLPLHPSVAFYPQPSAFHYGRAY